MVRKSWNGQELYYQELKLQSQKEQVSAIQADRRNAQDTLAYERAKFHADCAARNIWI